jgi:hypothetical protein
MTEALLNCPFCGGELLMQEHLAHEHFIVDLPPSSGSWTIECAACPCGMIADTKSEVIEIWNRRTPQPSGLPAAKGAVVKTWQERMPAERKEMQCSMNCSPRTTPCDDCVPVTIRGNPDVARDEELAELRATLSAQSQVAQLVVKESLTTDSEWINSAALSLRVLATMLRTAGLSAGIKVTEDLLQSVPVAQAALTDEKLGEIYDEWCDSRDDLSYHDLMRMVEAAHGIAASRKETTE